jgi:5-methylcytosine-specific restriction endonuclease McrA
VWERCGGFCEKMGCGRPISEEESHLHHVRMRSKGGDESMKNLEILCVRCHKKEHADRDTRWLSKSA